MTSDPASSAAAEISSEEMSTETDNETSTALTSDETRESNSEQTREELRNERDSQAFDIMCSELAEHGIVYEDFVRNLAPTLLTNGSSKAEIWRFLELHFFNPPRKRLTQYSTIDDAVKLISECKNILVLTGAGLSTSAGIPDFRSRDGLYVQISADYPDLPSPSSMFDIDYFRINPRPFFQFAKTIYPGNYQPTISHKFIKCIEDHGKLLRNYTQNIDTLERQAGIRRVIECHGSFEKASCTSCKYTVDGMSIKPDVMSGIVPLCPLCRDRDGGPEDGLGIMKPNIVFFREKLPKEFDNAIAEDQERADLLIVIGSSLRVKPVSFIPKALPPEVPQILINRESIGHANFDIELRGDSDEIVQDLCSRLGGEWTKICNLMPQ